MKKAIAGLAVAAVVAGLLVLGAGPAPAAGLERHEAATAVTDEVQTAVTTGEVAKIITVVKAAYSAYQLFAGGDMSVREATRQILNAIYSAKTEIIARIDAVAAAQARACAQDAVLDLENFDSFSRDSQEAFAMAARSCVNLIDSLLASGPDKAAADQLGFALQAVGPIMLIVRSRVGVSNASMVPVLVRSTQAVITQLKPTCSSRLLEGRTQWLCRVYGDHQEGYDPSFTFAERLAAARTSRPVAQAVLPQLSDLQELAGNIVLKKEGFENATTTWILGTGCAVVSTPTHSGSGAMKLTGGAPYRKAQQTVPAIAGASTQVSSWLKTDTIRAGSTRLQLLWLDATRKPTGKAYYIGNKAGGTTEWTYYTTTQTAPANAVYVQLNLLLDGASTGGFAYFDDIRLMVVDN